MTYKESYTVELKRELNTDFKKDIIALANCDGGEIYVGPLLGISGEVRRTATFLLLFFTVLFYSLRKVAPQRCPI